MESEVKLKGGREEDLRMVASHANKENGTMECRRQSEIEQGKKTKEKKQGERMERICGAEREQQ